MRNIRGVVIVEEERKYGQLLNQDIKIFRQYFKEMTKLIGITVIYRAAKPDKHYTTYSEIESNYFDPIAVGVIFDEHPTQQTLKKMGWVSELQESASIIHVPYDLPRLQQGALFIIPSGIDEAKGRVFRVSKLTNGIIYPATMTCEIVPEYENAFENKQLDYTKTDFNLLNNEEEL